MNPAAQFLSPSEAAQRLGVSTKALRIYEQRGLILPRRTQAGWRVYGPDEMARCAEIVALRELGLSLAQVARVLGGDTQVLESALAAHQTILEGRIRRIADTVEKVRHLREDLVQGQAPTPGDLVRLLESTTQPCVVLDLPWPWGGEKFALNDIRALNYIVGPLGCGKTRLARCIAEAFPDAAFLGLERLMDKGAIAIAQVNSDAALRSRVDQTLGWLVEDGATVSAALLALLAGLESEGSAVLVVDMLEQGLDKATQEAVISLLRRRATHRRPLFFLTRSNAILDLEAVGIDETIIFCPANHNPPTYVRPFRGTPGYEAVETCLASPEVRARTEGVIAWRPQVA